MENEDYILVRMTGSGNTGVEKYKPQVYLYITHMAKKLFG